MERILKHVPATAVLFLLSLVAAPALAAPAAAKPASSGSLIKGGLTKTATSSGYESTPLPVLIGNVIQALLGVVGIIFLVLTVYAGFLWMTAGGEPGKVDKAKKMLGNALIGLIIIVAAYAFTSFVVEALSTATAGTPAEKK